MKRFVLTMWVVALVVAAAGCAPQPTPTPVPPATKPAPTAMPPTAVPTAAPPSKFSIAVVPPALVSPYFITLADAAKESAAKNPNIELTVIAPSAETAIEEQIKIVEDLVQKKVNLIAISTANWDALTPYLQKARAAGTEVVCIDRVIPLEGVDVVSMLGVDEIKGGEIIGEYVVKVLNGKGNVAILEGVTGDYWSERRTKGFHNIADKYPDIKVVTTQPANWERALGMTTMENILQAHKDLDLVWGLNDNMALGALQAIETAGLQDKIKVVGYNADQEAKEAVKAGRMAATAAQQPAKIAQTIVEEIAPKLMAGKRSEIQPVIHIPVALVTQENIDQFLAPSAAEFWNVPYKAKKQWVLGVSYQNLAFPYVAAMQKAIQNRAKAIGVKIIETDAFNDTNKELANVENLLAQKIDLLLFEAASLEASVASIEAANKAGVPVVQFNGKAKGGEYVTFVGSNQIESGLLLGKWLLDLYAKLGKDKLKGIYLRGVAGQITDIARSDGVKQALTEAGKLDKFEFVEQHADYDRGKGQVVTESILSKSKDYDFIIANNDDMILGALAVVEQMGLAGKIPMCGVDGLPEALEAIKAGKLSATVFQNPEGQAAGGLQVAVEYLEGKTFPKEILIPFELVTEENVDKIMEIATRVYIK